MRQDLVTPALRAAEREIDHEFQSNPLFRYTFGEAAWYFMAFCEERLVTPDLKALQGDEVLNSHEKTALADEVVNHAKWPLRWILQTCPRGTSIPRGYSDEPYKASWDLSRLASEYLTFESAFTYASLGLTSLRLDGNRIVPSGPIREDTRYEAYDRLADLEEHGTRVNVSFIADLVTGGIRIDGDRFSYPLNPNIVRQTMERLEGDLMGRFRLPAEWTLTQYSLSDFAAVVKCLWCISAIHHVSRLLAATRGCRGLGYCQSLVVMGYDDLLRRLVRYSAIPESRVRAVIADLTFGSRMLEMPDPAFQPLVSFTDTHIGWAPTLFLTNALERNLMVLLNRTPDARRAYLSLNQQKENLLRSRLTQELKGLGLRFWNGDVHGWEQPLDIDLAIMSDEEKCCLLLELKSFLAPAEPREIRDRAEEIARGIQQVKTRRTIAKRQPHALSATLGISDDYKIVWAVCSETSIGAAWVQDDSVPVVRAAHFIRNLTETGRLVPVCDWLTSRGYLPVEGKHYADVADVARVGNWELEWHGIRGLGDELER